MDAPNDVVQRIVSLTTELGNEVERLRSENSRLMMLNLSRPSFTSVSNQPQSRSCEGASVGLLPEQPNKSIFIEIEDELPYIPASSVKCIGGIEESMLERQDSAIEIEGVDSLVSVRDKWPSSDPNRVTLVGTINHYLHLHKHSEARLHWDETYGFKEHHWWLIQPDSHGRQLWLILWIICFLLDFWLTTFRFVFFDRNAVSSLLIYADTTLRVFFFADIILNFFSGIFKDNMIVMDYRVVFSEYLRFWFWIDLLTAIPFENIVLANCGPLRGVKIFHVMKILRLSRISSVLVVYEGICCRMGASNRSMGTTKRSRRLLLRSVHILWLVKVMIILGLVAHVHAVLWGFLQPSWAVSVTFDLAFRRYATSFWWSYSILVGGYPSAPTNVPSLRVLEAVLLIVRAVLVGYGLSWIVSLSLVLRAGEAQQLAKQLSTFEQLTRQGVGVKTQMQIMNSLRETASARIEKSQFEQMMDEDMPRELRRAICVEMWSPKLLKLEIIRSVNCENDMLAAELAQHVWEEIYASEVVLFKTGELALHAYLVIEGTIIVGTGAICEAPFTEGMWFEEQVLVKTGLLRRGNAKTIRKSILLVVDAMQFSKLVDHMKLRERFDEICANELWRGMCGRCGKLGDHFPGRCPLVAGTVRNDLSRDLTIYLKRNDLMRLEQYFYANGILTLDDLKNCNNIISNDTIELSAREASLLSPEAVGKFTADQARLVAESRCRASNDHLIFISHYKSESGTEAALMREHLLAIMQENRLILAESAPGASPIFLDSEDLADLTQLQVHVRHSQALLLLLTPNVLSRPWVLVEVCTAMKANVPVLPVILLKPGQTFQIPPDEFYTGLLDGTLVGEEGLRLFASLSIDMEDVVQSVKQVFFRIAASYSPHRTKKIREAELREILQKTGILQKLDTELQSAELSAGTMPSFSSSRRLGSFLNSARL
eukprot:TRINITY_DN21557_c0_g1_i1.p1 TRINITY_DN21557_c0_g1~~TRINITY_DN21557_c0_g1_i1.p1  ORF type:complete len:941 (+),score=130.26 TRINITY_DN21557_c0_g1_i1:100-2922(+)